MRRLSYCLLVFCFAVSACSTEVTGPEPKMTDEPDELSTDPSFVCNEDPGTWVTVDGEGFSPLVVDAIASEDDHDVELPTVTLDLRLDPTGDVEDESFSVTLDSPLGGEDGQIRWLDDSTLEIRISDDLELPEGVYDITVTNPDGQIATEHEALGVMPRPSLDKAAPELTCIAQGERQIVLSGDNLLVLQDSEDDDHVPTIELGDQQVEVVDTDDCRELHSTFGGHQICKEATVGLDETSFEAGVYDVRATNFEPAGCPSKPEEDGVTVTITGPPQAHDISPTPICSEQIDYEAVQIDGQDIIVVGEAGDRLYPEVTIGDRSYEPIDADGCQDIDTAPSLNAQRCDQLTINIEPGDVGEQVDADVAYADLDVRITNPEPVGCHSTEDLALTAVPPPSVQLVEPDPICTAQFENTFSVEGHGFVAIGDDEPVVHVGDQTYEIDEMQDCVDVPTPDTETISCQRLTIAIAEGDLEPQRADVSVENPATAACESTDDSTVQVVAPPMVAEVDPEPLCIEGEDRSVEIIGEHFLSIDDDLPTITVGGNDYPVVDIDDCEPLPVDDDNRDILTCQSLFVDIDAGSLADGDHQVVVTNPQTAACSSEEDTTVRTVPPPQITALTPHAVCNDDASASFDVEGNYLFEVDGTAPDILVDGEIYASTGVHCSDYQDYDDVRLCDTVQVDVDASILSADIMPMVAVNPDPIGCQSPESDPFYAADGPAIVMTEPSGICEGDTFDGALSLYGEFIYDPDGDFPTVTIEGQTVAVDSTSGCSTTSLGDEAIASCDQLDTTVPTAFRDQEFQVTIAGSDPVACGSDSIIVEQQPSPTVDSVSPLAICGSGGSFVVTGQNFSQDADVYLDGTPANLVDVNADGTEITAQFDGPLDGSAKTLEVVNPGDCGDTYEQEQIAIIDGPTPIYVDPPAAFDGMNTQVTIYATGLDGRNIDVVELIHPDGTSTGLSFSPDSADRPHILQATVPEGMLDATETSVDFGIRLTDDEDSCSETTEDLLTITSELSVAIKDIEPPFGTTDESTSITINAEDPPEDDTMTQFEATPRAYLSAPNEDSATEIRALQFLDETELNGIVPSGLDLGDYDLIVVNPDGSVGVLDEAFTVVQDPPPLVDSVSPGSWTNNEDALPVSIEGQHFRDDPDPSVEVFCLPPGDDDDTDEDDLDQPNDIVVTDVFADEVLIEVDTNNLEHLSACYLRLTNADGTYGEYSPITITNPAGKFVEFQAGTAFDLPRRAPTTFSGVPSRQDRYLYVVGGDDGTEDTAFSSSEFASLNRFGAPRSWNYLPFDLPTGRTLANGVRIDDFVYLIGGSDEGTVTDEILRAHVLNPLDVPEIIDVGLDLDDLDGDSGLDSGVYYYRVSAVLSDDNAINPGGETIASEPQPINLPLDDIEVTISWSPPEELEDDIVGYRVYRNVEADDPYGNESLLADLDVSTTSYTDDGSENPAAGVHTVPTGSFGTWHHFANLEQERMVAGIDSIENPGSEGEHFVYVVGGEDSTGDFRADYEYFSIDVAAPRQQSLGQAPTIGQFDGDDMVLPGARGELEIAIAHEGNAASVADVAPQLFVLGGQSTGTDNNRDIYVTSINADGHLDDWTALSSPGQRLNNDRYGHAAAAINDNLVVAGGANGNASGGGRHAEIECGADCPTAEVATPPGWQDLGAQMSEERVWMGHRTFRGFWYLTGGLNDAGEPTNTVDFSVAGGTP